MPDEISTRVALTGEKEYRDELKAIAEAQKVLSSETAKTTAAFDKNDKSVEALTARNGQLEKSLELQRQKVEACRKGLENASKAWGEADARTVKWHKDLNYAEAQITRTEKSIRDNTDAINAMNRAADSKSLKNLAEGAKAAGESLDKMGNKLTMGLTIPLVAAGTAAANFSSDTVESIGKVEVAFGYAAEGIKNWSDSTLTSIGLAKGTALDMAALYGDMATSMGFAQATAADMSKTLVGLGADLASYKNISIDVANTALKAIFTGETESLKGLGVVMTQANLQAYAMAQGFKTAYKDMDQTQQVAVRYQYVLAQTANAQGDFARTSDNTANQLRIFQESLKEAAALAGDQLLPIITPIVTRLSELVQSFGQLDDGTRKAIVQTALFVATLGPMLKLTGGVTTAINAAVAAFKALTVAKGADVIVTGAQTAATTAATAAQTGLNAAMLANPIGPIVTAVGMLVAGLLSLGAVAALTAENHNKLTEELEKSRKAHQDAVAGIGEYRAHTLGMMQSLEELMAVEQKSAAEKATIIGLVDQLNEAVPNLSLAYNEQTNSLNMSTEALGRYIEAEARRQLQQENTARLIDLEKDRIRILEEQKVALQDLYAAEQAYEKAKQDSLNTPAETFDAIGMMDLSAAFKEAKDRVEDLTTEMETNNAESAALKAEYNGLSTAADNASSSTVKATASTEELSKATRTLVSETETLSSAFAEQKENGSLSLDTTLKLIDAGYGAALAVDEETGSVRLNAEAYATLAQKKIDEQIAGLQDGQRQKRVELLYAEAFAARASAEGNMALALSYQAQADALKGEVVSSDATIAQLNALRNGLGSVVTGKWSSKAATSFKSSSKKTETQEDRNQDAYKAAVEELDFRHDMGEISEAEYYARLEALRDRYLTKDSDAWRDATVKLHQYREKAQKEAEEEAAKAKQDAYAGELADLKYFRDLSLISEESYYASLAKLRDNHLEKDSEEWRRVTVELHQWQQKQREATLKAEQEAYEAAQKRRADLVKQYTEQRIAAIKAEQKAEEDRLNALIDGIDEEVAARKRLRQVQSDDDAVAKAQKTLDAAKKQLEFERDANTRYELEKEVIRAQQALDKALQSKADNDFYFEKEQEKDALRDQLDDVREKAQKQIDGAPAWAEQRVSEYEAAQERRARAEEEARRKDQEQWEREQATMQTIQKAATGALAAAGKVVTQITNAVTKVTNHNSVSVTTGASMLTSGQMARAMEKAIEKMAK